jgi:hypothetical protein
MASRRVAAFTLTVSLALVAASCGSPARPVVGPTRGRATSPSTTSPTPQPSFEIPPIPDGTYTSHVTRADAVRFHVRPQNLDEQTGNFTLTLAAGRWKLVQSADHPVFNPIIEGIYFGSGHVVTFEFQFPASDTGTDTVRWRYDRTSKKLFLAVLSAVPDVGAQSSAADALAGDRTVFQSHPWVKTD